MKLKKGLLLVVAVLVISALVIPGCAAPAPAPAPKPAPAPTPAPAPKPAPTPAPAPAPSPAPAPKPVIPPKPDMFIWGTHEVGTWGHVMISLIAETVVEKTGINVRCVPNGTYVGRAWSARLGDTMTTVELAAGMQFLQEGMYEYSGYDWGPQPIQYIKLSRQVGCALVVRGNSDITDAQQLKGKKIGRTPGTSALIAYTMSLLAFFGLSKDDVVWVDYSTPVAMWNAVTQGKIDSCFHNCTSPQIYEMESVTGVRYFEMDPSDKEGWARAQAISPIVARTVKIAAGLKEGAPPLNLSCSAYPDISAFDTLDPDIAYWITKAVIETFPDYAPKNPSLAEDFTVDMHWALWEKDICPLHEGAVRYYKDAGMWNDKREKMQQERLKYQAELKKLWDKVVEEATSKKISEKDFPKFWTEKRIAAGFSAPPF